MIMTVTYNCLAVILIRHVFWQGFHSEALQRLLPTRKTSTRTSSDDGLLSISIWKLFRIPETPKPHQNIPWRCFFARTLHYTYFRTTDASRVAFAATIKLIPLICLSPWRWEKSERNASIPRRGIIAIILPAMRRAKRDCRLIVFTANIWDTISSRCDDN